MAQTVSANFRQALTTSHQIATQVDAYYNGVLTVPNLPITDGSVTLDRTSAVRRALSLTVADKTLLPWNPTDPLAVYGQRLVVRRGIQFPNGTTELVTLGTFRVDQPSGDVYDGPVTVSGSSSEVVLQDDQFMVPTSTAGFTTCVDAIRFLITQTIPGATISNATSDGRNPVCPVATWDAGSGRWDAVTQLATAMTAEVFVDANDRFVIGDIPTTATASVDWDIAEGPTGTLMSAARQMARASVYNVVVVSSDNTASGLPPLSATAEDNDPTSPTYVNGPYGRVVFMYSTSLATTVDDCQTLANALLAQAITPNIQSSVTAVPNPAMEAGDCIRTTARGAKQLYILQSVGIPLVVGGDFPVTLAGGKDDPS